ncbi:nudix hydrolase 12, mitochondrial-like [Euphorbia lathyris]|uniref:nudix hydrolase 12, mitochondrial-like n=1 Tax=Euphorbia lathyris TaxID=212925 RepID=UPI0033132DCF
MSVLARTGRHKQRYQDHLRLVAGCIPYKRVEDKTCRAEERLLVLMISTPKRNDLVFPKGGWEDDESLTEAACREAYEEAGVQGVISEIPLGVWEFRSKSNENSSSKVGCCKGYMFALQVTQELHQWPGLSNYNRIWVEIDKAFEVCRYEWMRDALKSFMKSVSDTETEVEHQMMLMSSTSSYLGNNSSCCPTPQSPILTSSPNFLEL